MTDTTVLSCEAEQLSPGEETGEHTLKLSETIRFQGQLLERETTVKRLPGGGIFVSQWLSGDSTGQISLGSDALEDVLEWAAADSGGPHDG